MRHINHSWKLDFFFQPCGESVPTVTSDFCPWKPIWSFAVVTQLPQGLCCTIWDVFLLSMVVNRGCLHYYRPFISLRQTGIFWNLSYQQGISSCRTICSLDGFCFSHNFFWKSQKPHFPLLWCLLFVCDVAAAWLIG